LILPITTASPLCRAALERVMKRDALKAELAMSKRTFLPDLIYRILMHSSRRSSTGSIPWPTFGHTVKPVKGLWTGSSANGNQ
jgi:hypothetical protein